MHLPMALMTGGAARSGSRQAVETADQQVTATLEAVLASLEDSKAEDIVAIDITGRSSVADHMIVATGRSNRHVGAIADRLTEDLKDRIGDPRVEGMPSCDWVLLDLGDIIVHLFRPEVRQFYNLERLWQPDGPSAH